MKRLFSLLIAILMAVSLCACGAVPEETTPTLTAPPTDPDVITEPTEEVTEEATFPNVEADYDFPLTALSSPLAVSQTFASDGTLIYEYICQDVAFFFDDAPVADRVMLDLLNVIDTPSSDSILASAQAAYTGQNDWNPYYLKVTLNPQRLDQSILSLFGGELSNEGSPSTSFAPLAVTYDLATGNALSFRDVLEHDYAPAALCQLIIDALVPQAESAQLFWDYQDVILERFSDSDSYTDDWYLSDTGLCFFFSPYDIAPYVSGTIVAEIPYEKLMGILNASYFPAEKVAMNGKIYGARFDEDALFAYSRFVEATVDDIGEQVLLFTDTAVSNVRIEKGSWDMDGVLFTPDYTVLAADTLCSGDAIILQTDIPDAAPNLRLTYISGGETITRYISQSGMDGSILLLETA